MKKGLSIAFSVLMILPIMGCSNQNGSLSEINNFSSSAILEQAEIETPESIAPEIPEREFDVDTQSALKTYYDAQNHPAYEMCQKD
ncbi:MAG: hypothetical protein QM697_18990, partial [Lachnospiraceae bacterium]